MRLTEAAVHQIRMLTTKTADPDHSLRIALQPGGCCGQFLYMSIDIKHGNDLVVEQDGVRVFVDGSLVPVMEGAILDYSDRLKPPRFRLRNARVDHRCPCGRSIGSPYRGKSKQCRAYELPPWLKGG